MNISIVMFGEHTKLLSKFTHKSLLEFGFALAKYMYHYKLSC